MKAILVTVSNETYSEMLCGRRVRGSLALNDAQTQTGNFLSYAKPSPRPRPRKVQQLPHGRTEIYGDHVRLTLNVAGEPSDFTALAIHDDATDACRFVAKNGYRSFGYEA